MLYMLDTNAVSDIIRSRSTVARSRLAALQAGEAACISSITEGELLYGLAKIPIAAARRSALDWFLARLPVLPWGREEASAYGRLRARQEGLGTPLETMDMLIAAHAIAAKAVLVTRDKAFLRLGPPFEMVNWSTDVSV